LLYLQQEIAMNKDEIKGKLKQGVGNLTGDVALQDEGAADEATGELRETAGTARRKVGEAVEKIGEQIKR
jgi:uncharacterized protein YjbJ (UPF0337 family)